MSKQQAILCIDDEQMILDSLQEQIQKHFGDKLLFETADSAEEAMEVLEELRSKDINVLVIVSDWLMPGQKGDEFLIESHKLYPEIVPIMLTGHATQEVIRNAEENANLFSCINKPWKEDNLIRILKNALLKFESVSERKKKEVILCVDDEEIILDALRGQLEDTWGEEFVIETADNPEDAIEIFEELKDEGYKVPVIISDYVMPQMKGDEFLQHIHQIAPETHKILLTGQASLEGVTNAINNAKLYRYIPKPWDKEDLALTIKEAVRSYVQGKEIIYKNAELEAVNLSLEEKVKRRTAELELANATKDKFFSIIAQDLKGSFNNLIGFSETLINDFKELDDEGKLNFLNRIKVLSDNTYKLLQNLLDWARVQTSQIKYEPELFNVKEIVDEVLEMQKDHSDSKKISVVNEVEDSSVVYADKSMLRTIVRNISSNAIKFTSEGGEVKLIAKPSETRENFLEFAIADNGIGMSEDKVSRLFTISEKVKTFGTAKEEGTGLGLILCKEFVEKNSGKIKVESKEGEGSCFTFELPTVLN